MFFTIPNFLERMLEEPLSPLTVLSISAIITTISLFFCGIPICLQIYRRSSTHEISGFPFLMGFLGGAFWLRYGLLKADLTMVTVNVVGVSLMFLYLLFYLYYSRPRTGFLFQLLIVKTMVAIMLVLVHLYGLVSLQALGFVCMTFNIINFGAPLAGLTVVLRNRSCSTLPLPLCVANLLVSSQWCIYGVCVHDIYIIIPNGTGIVLALVQISLFLVFPRQEGDHAPLAKCCPCILDMEKAYEGGLIADVDIDNHSNANGTNGRRRRSDKIRDDSNQTDSLRARRNKFLHRQRVIDRRMIPTTRTACIEFLRANGGGGGFDASFGSVSSRATADSWMSNSGASISTRIFSSTSHPELFNGTAVQQAADLDGAIVVDVAQNPTSTDLIDANANAGNAEFPAMMPSLTQSQYNLCVPSSTLANAVVNGFGTTMKSSSRADESQLLTEVPEIENANVGVAPAGEEGGGADLLFVRTLSAPDLLAQQSRRS